MSFVKWGRKKPLDLVKRVALNFINFPLWIEALYQTTTLLSRKNRQVNVILDGFIMNNYLFQWYFTISP